MKAKRSERLSAYIDPLTLLDLSDQLRYSDDPINRELAQHLYPGPVLGFSMRPPKIVALGSVVNKLQKPKRPTKSKRAKNPAETAEDWGKAFIFEIFNDLRKIICGKGKTPAKLGHKSTAVLTSLAAFIAQYLGISNPTALGIAVLVLLSLGNATKTAFCRTTNADQIKKLLKMST